MLKKLGEILNMLSRYGREKKIQIKLLEMKAVTSEMKNTQGRINGMSDGAENISEPEDIAIETLQNETPRENKNYEQNISDLMGQLELA